MEQSERFDVVGKKDCTCTLSKSLHGLKQSPRKWKKWFNEFIVSVVLNIVSKILASMM